MSNKKTHFRLSSIRAAAGYQGSDTAQPFISQTVQSGRRTVASAPSTSTGAMALRKPEVTIKNRNLIEVDTAVGPVNLRGVIPVTTAITATHITAQLEVSGVLFALLFKMRFFLSYVTCLNL